MKKTLFLFIAILAMSQSGIAQSDSVNFEIIVADSTAIVGTTGSGLPVFSSSAINSILASYYITEFRQSTPEARLKYLRNTYKVRCNSIALANDLKTANPALFPNFFRTNNYSIAYTPNDWNLIPGGSDYLKYINAENAWTMTKGDPSVAIGVLDLFFNTSHPDFYNSSGASKINSVGPNTYKADHHGTAVASMVAGATDNGIGLAAIGFNCQLDLSTDWSTNNMMLMSKRGVRIINCSWIECADYPTLNLRDHFLNQGRFNDIYENGTLMCFAAGNGKYQECPRNPDNYIFPASYDHVFSTTSIGWKNPKGGSTNHNVTGMHQLEYGDPTSTYNHNSRIDICAPTFLGAFRYDATDPTFLYYTSASGTSSSSPLVAGTAGLIQSALKQKEYPKFKDANFSPYQLEWILKKSAIKDFLSYPENAAYAGKLGAGRLDASSAAFYGITHSVNDAATQTMYIKGIEINTICAPGFSSNGVLPKLKPIIVNGTGPYTYVWEEVPDGTNMALLDDVNIAEPTIVGLKSTTFPKIFYYRLTVYDNSPIAQKVAMKTFKIQLKTEGFDLAMRDSYMDMMEEANMQRINDPRDWDTWTSPDIWNRQAADAGLEHQNPEYFVSDPNHLYTRIRNIGCAANPNNRKLRTYWTKASTGENWDVDWTTKDVCGIGAMQPGGREITTGSGIAIPILQPGDQTIIHQDWYPNRPELYCGTPSTFEVCFLARIEGPTYFDASGWHPFGMTIPEKLVSSSGYAGVGENIRNNNNIVTRNTILTNLRPDNIKTMKRQLIIANGNDVATTYNFEFASERSIHRHFAGDFSSLGSVTLHLGNLYDVWVNSGSHGTVASQNAQARTVTFDGANTLRLDSLPLTANQSFTVELEFTLDSPIVVNEVSNHVFHARQFEVSNPHEVYGAVNYHVNVSPATQNNQRKTLENTVSYNESFQISPNPTNGVLYISYGGEKENATEIVITDITGKKLMTEKANFTTGSKKEINLSRFASGVYLINISNANGTNEVYKVVKE